MSPRHRISNGTDAQFDLHGLMPLLRRLLERSNHARSILAECFACFQSVDCYPLLLILTRHHDRIALLDVVNGDWDLHRTRACLERTLNPIFEQSTISINEVNFTVHLVSLLLVSLADRISFAGLGWRTHGWKYPSSSLFRHK